MRIAGLKCRGSLNKNGQKKKWWYCGTGHRYTGCERWPSSRCKSLRDKFPTELSRDAINVRMEWSFPAQNNTMVNCCNWFNRLHLKPKSNKHVWTLKLTWSIMFQSCKHLSFLARTVVHFVVAPLYFVWFPNSFVHVETALSSPAWDSDFLCAIPSNHICQISNCETPFPLSNIFRLSFGTTGAFQETTSQRNGLILKCFWWHFQKCYIMKSCFISR